MYSVPKREGSTKKVLARGGGGLAGHKRVYLSIKGLGCIGGSGAIPFPSIYFVKNTLTECCSISCSHASKYIISLMKSIGGRSRTHTHTHTWMTSGRFVLPQYQRPTSQLRTKQRAHLPPASKVLGQITRPHGIMIHQTRLQPRKTKANSLSCRRMMPHTADPPSHSLIYDTVHPSCHISTKPFHARKRNNETNLGCLRQPGSWHREVLTSKLPGGRWSGHHIGRPSFSPACP